MITNLDISNFNNFLKDEEENIKNEFLRKYVINLRRIEDIELEKKEIFFASIIKYICNGDINNATLTYKELIKYNVELDIPYVMIIYELINLKKIIMEKLLYKNVKNELIQLHNLQLFFEDMIAKTYLEKYIKELDKKSNFSISSLNNISSNNIVLYYRQHLEWLENISKSIVLSDVSIFPETNHNICNFGKWLKKDAKKTILNEAEYNKIVKLHENLHFFANKIKNCLLEDEDNNHIILIYLEKCEMLSLSLGTELALIDNTLINMQSLKDPLTGALNRQNLNNLYQNQLNISLTTFKPFVVAMLDLDYFKKINDTFGHIAGDKMLQSFVELLKEHIRASDMLIRFGGEEFLLILPAVNSKKAKEILNEIREAFENFVLDFEGNKISTTVSIGMIEIHQDNSNSSFFKNLDNTISLVDKKLYEAKNSGRNTIC